MKSILIVVVLFLSQTAFGQGIFIDHRHTDLSQIPDEWIDAAKANLRIHYFRRSHGSQVDAGGMTALKSYFGAKYDYNDYASANSLYLSIRFLSVDYDPAIWASDTRAYLDNPTNAAVNVIMWAWSFDFYISDIQAYLDTMEDFIAEYGPNGTKIQDGTRTVPVTFVFQTACSLEGDAENEIIFNGNKLIRAHCANNNRILFDFNDIECYNPDGVYFGEANSDGSYGGLKRLGDDISYNIDANTRGNWGIEWIAANPNHELSKLAASSVCVSCAHSDGSDSRSEDSRLHCVLKGRAAWWMWAVLAGWEAGITTGVEQKQSIENIGELKNYPNPFETSTTIAYNLKENAQVVLELWNSNGQKISTLINQKQTKGNYEVPVNLDNRKGIYFYTLKVNGQQISNKMIKLK